MNEKNDKLDFVAVGDIVTDAFVKLSDAWIENDNPSKSEELCMNFGDKLPYDDITVVPAVGNSPNATVSAHRLGLNSALATNLGDDRYGKEQVETLESEGINTEFVKVHEGWKSNYHIVLRFKAERTILVNHQEYPYELPDLREPKWIYLSSLAENSLPYHEMIADYVEKHPSVKLAFQPGTFQMKLGKDKLARLYKNAELFFCNKEEAQKILDTKEDDLPAGEAGIKKLLSDMHDLGPNIAVITDGPEGAYVYDGNEYFHGPMYPDPKPPVDRTGAGDSFSSTFTSALALGESIETALLWGPINSMSVVQYIGAQEGLLTRDKLQEHLENAPDDYVVSKI